MKSSTPGLGTDLSKKLFTSLLKRYEERRQQPEVSLLAYLTDPANPVKEALFSYDNMTDIVSFGVTRYMR